ncbi:peptidoglycan-binding domain-containing protein, partial [Dyella sp.]|uniref:peptidoglycan-binding domain-containing protein n=1 Tax=Dyella sp. TaxID=1869338 RepID=UPI002ED3436C
AGSPELQLALADYDNQFSISGIGQKSQPNSMMSYLEGNSVKLPGGELKAGDPITRTDIQNFINATKYGVENPDSVASREQRLTAALDKLNIEHTPAQQGGSAPARTGSHTLREGDHSPAVGNLQHQLNQLGNLPHGKLMEDSRFGNGTKEAVEAFQRAHNLTPDGVVGDKTRSAMDEALKQQQQQSPQSQTAPATSSPDAPAAPTANAAQLNDPAHPGYDLFKQAQTAVYQMDTQHGRVPDQGSDNLAGTLAVKSYENGMTGINRVMLSEDASRAWAVQGDMNSPFKQYADVGVAQGVNTSIAQSTANWNQAQSQRGVDPSTQQTQQQNQNQNQQQPQPQTASAQR